jgi:hypothetical protein
MSSMWRFHSETNDKGKQMANFAWYCYLDIVVGLPMPDRSKVMTLTKRDTLVLQVGGQ